MQNTKDQAEITRQYRIGLRCTVLVLESELLRAKAAVAALGPENNAAAEAAASSSKKRWASFKTANNKLG